MIALLELLSEMESPSKSHRGFVVMFLLKCSMALVTRQVEQPMEEDKRLSLLIRIFKIIVFVIAR